MFVLLDEVAVSVPVAVPLLVAVPVPEAVPDAEPEIEPEALTPALLLVSDGVVVAELDEVPSTDCVLLLVELVAAESDVVSVPEVLVFVSTEQPVTPRAMAISADVPIRVNLFRFMVCLPNFGVE